MTFAEKVKLVRKSRDLTQAEFAESIGVSRGHLANIELGKVDPTQLLLNCISLTYNINKDWLTDDNREDLSVLEKPQHITSLIVKNYELLNDEYKRFIENQINQFLELQKNKK